MSLILNKTNEKISLSHLAIGVYDAVFSVASSVRSNPITTVGLLGVNIGASLIGQAASIRTGGLIQLNNIVPQPMRDVFRKMGRGVGKVNRGVGGLIAGILRVNNNAFFKGVIAAPIVEEIVFRLPLLIASLKIDSLSSEFITSPILENVLDLTGGQALKVALAVILSIGFTYAHDSNPVPARAAGIFASGLTLSHLTLRPTGGLGNAMVAHAIHNLVPTLMGYDIGSGITPHSIEEDSQTEEKKIKTKDKAASSFLESLTLSQKTSPNKMQKSHSRSRK